MKARKMARSGSGEMPNQPKCNTTETMATFNIETEREDDGRWIAEVVEIAGAMAYGLTREQASAKAQAIALHILADRVENGEVEPELVHVSFQAA